MTSTHDELAQAAPYVLGALDPVERRAFEAHLAGCETCSREVRSLQRVTGALALSVPQHTPAADVRSRVLRAATGTADRDRDRTARGGVVQSWLPVAAALMLTTGLGAYAWLLHGRVSTMEARLADAENRAATATLEATEARRAADEAQAAMAVLAAPDLAQFTLAGQPIAPQASARALWSRNRGMVFTTAGLPAAPQGRVYQVWVLSGAARISVGLLPTDASGRASAVFPTPPDIAPPTGVAVTLEPAGGVPQPTGDMYLVSSL